MKTKKVGRPNKVDKRDIEIRFRVNQDELDLIDFIAKDKNMSRSHLLRALAQTYYVQHYFCGGLGKFDD